MSIPSPTVRDRSLRGALSRSALLEASGIDMQFWTLVRDTIPSTFVK
jgi:hypothetical protein